MKKTTNKFPKKKPTKLYAYKDAFGCVFSTSDTHGDPTITTTIILTSTH
jgi:hypothetical protein